MGQAANSRWSLLRCSNVNVGDSTIVIQGATSHGCAADSVACRSLHHVPMSANPAKAQAKGVPASPEDSVPKAALTTLSSWANSGGDMGP
mmetsp:Transcript_146891/g.258910  ORF Transcript_146891/g.258910 Transcript_146891/m.258910 type:complete len:90 (-) Transcript_146891:1030-1299(-)